MLDLEILKKIDSDGMYTFYDRWPEIAFEAYNQNHEQVDFGNVDHIIFGGMGGSGAIGDIFSSILSKTKIHVSIIKGYLLPKTIDSNSLVVTTSISGNTKETLTILDSAKKLDCKIIAFSSGGKMLEYCRKQGIEYRKIPEMHSPRVSFSGFLYSMLKILEPNLPIQSRDINESISHLESIKEKISSTNLNEDNPSLDIARWLQGIPLIYYPWGLQSAAIRFKNSLQENAKMHAIAEDIIEACHNGIVSWERPSEIQPILLQGVDDYIKTKERWKILKEYFKMNNIEYREVFSVNGGILSKLISMIYLLDYSSIYAAVLSKIDPSPVRSIDFVKERL